jgi:hypothetical protein
MIRTLIGAAVGACVGILALATYVGVEGFIHGGAMAARPSMPPGWEAALLGAFVAVAYFWWLAGGVGAWIGGLIGLGIAAVGRFVNENKFSC